MWPVWSLILLLLVQITLLWQLLCAIIWCENTYYSAIITLHTHYTHTIYTSITQTNASLFFSLTHTYTHTRIHIHTHIHIQTHTGIWRQKNVKIKKNVISFFGADVTSDVGIHVNKGTYVRHLSTFITYLLLNKSSFKPYVTSFTFLSHLPIFFLSSIYYFFGPSSCFISLSSSLQIWFDYPWEKWI